jgi:hypothetical protein
MIASAVEIKPCTPGISNRAPSSKQVPQIIIASKPTPMRFNMITLLPWPRRSLVPGTVADNSQAMTPPKTRHNRFHLASPIVIANRCGAIGDSCEDTLVVCVPKCSSGSGKPTFPGFPARRARFFVSSRHTATKFGRNQPRWQPNRPVSCLAGPKLVAWPSSRHTSAVVVCRI